MMKLKKNAEKKEGTCNKVPSFFYFFERVKVDSAWVNMPLILINQKN